MKRATGLFVLASGFLLAAKPATADKYLFLKLPGITGTSTTAPHVGDIPLLSFSAGVSAKKGIGATCSDLSVMKVVDVTSPALFGAVLAGIDFPTGATLTFAQDPPIAGPPVDVYTIKLINASMTSVQNSGSNEIPTESLSLHATSLVITYTPAVGSPVTTTVICK